MSSDARLTAFGACPAPVRRREVIVLGHGSGGRLTGELVEQLFVPAFANPALAALDDQAVLPVERGRIAFTTDSFVVTPIFFRGGDIGELAVNGTVNDLAMGGARPLALSLSFILEEGLPMADLERIVASARAAAERARVPIVTGDTKVVGRGSCDRIFINTSGVGVVPDGVRLGSSEVRAGDVVLVSGTVGDHGVAIMTEREGLELEGGITSDTAPLADLVVDLLAACPDVHAMRDPTRGGVATVLVEIASRRGLGVELDEPAVPVSPGVRGACELLGLDPLFVACEGRLVAFVPEANAGDALAAMRGHALGRDATCIGRVTAEHAGMVVARTAIGGRRIIDLPFTEQLPRIC